MIWLYAEILQKDRDFIHFFEMGTECKICVKDGWLCPTHSFSNSSSTENLVEIGHFSDVNESSEQRRDGDVCYAMLCKSTLEVNDPLETYDTD